MEPVLLVFGLGTGSKLPIGRALDVGRGQRCVSLVHGDDTTAKAGVYHLGRNHREELSL